jgi:hypothetical protein
MGGDVLAINGPMAAFAKAHSFIAYVLPDGVRFWALNGS